MKKVFFFSILSVLVLTPQAFAEFRVMDYFAAEVLLSKPDIVSNIDFLKYAENVVVQEHSVTYRSDFDDRIAFVLTDVNQGDGPHGLSVRLQLPVKEDSKPYVYSSVELADAKLSDVGKDFLESLGYEVEMIAVGTRDEDPVRDGVDERPVERPADEKPVWDEGAAIEGIPIPADDTIADIPVINDNDNSVPAPPPVDVSAAWIQSIFLSKGDIRWIIVQYGSGVEFVLNIPGTDTISNEARQDFQQMIAFYGLDRNAMNLLDGNMAVMKTVDLVPDADINRDKFDFKLAMKTELEWLKSNGIIAGITEQDVSEIANVLEPGMAGWYSRVVYSDGSWLPFYKTEEGNAVRTLVDPTEDGIAPGEADLVAIPADAIALPTANVGPTGKAITRWGRVRSGF
jgi:hypothetical protein